MIRNGGTTMSPFLGVGKYCGRTIPTVPDSSSNEVYIQFVGSYGASVVSNNAVLGKSIYFRIVIN